MEQSTASAVAVPSARRVSALLTASVNRVIETDFSNEPILRRIRLTRVVQFNLTLILAFLLDEPLAPSAV